MANSVEFGRVHLPGVHSGVIPPQILKRKIFNTGAKSMKRIVFAGVVCFLFATLPAQANSISVIGTIPTPDTPFALVFSLSGGATVNFQTFGFGGGTNALGTLISPGGFDPMISLFSGTGPGASIVLTGGNPAASAAILGNNAGACPPAGMVTIGTGLGSSVCGDAQMSLALGPGIYTLLLTDGNYIPLAVNPGPPGASTVGDGFTDFSGGVFQTCNTTSNGSFCITPTGNFALDVTTQGSVTVVPEPATLAMLGSGLAALAGMLRRRSGRSASKM
jgi:hypothetical protein